MSVRLRIASSIADTGSPKNEERGDGDWPVATGDNDDVAAPVTAALEKDDDDKDDGDDASQDATPISPLQTRSATTQSKARPDQSQSGNGTFFSRILIPDVNSLPSQLPIDDR